MLLNVPCMASEISYNDAHMRTRVIIEHIFGLLKSQFLCHVCSGGAPQYSYEKVADINMVYFMLHNIARWDGVHLDLDLGSELNMLAPAADGYSTARGNELHHRCEPQGR
ncbi:putative nuclease HARBI1 [Rhinatrema bivittatum]|uniref:putative nuclease HARBI1 n=1 Tax=Rhinatrema bivittatum TaxID=194408 RepID=UPI001126C00B|nr:putative nuclease HARBI1 [Rhinatrema bivittatum]